ncbi:hypothetical protein ABK040_013482 [Willaertia magna]
MTNNKSNSTETFSKLCTLLGSVIILLPSLGFLITLIILQTKFNIKPEGDNLVNMILNYVTISIFLITGIVGFLSICGCGLKYRYFCSIHWSLWIALSSVILLTLLGIYSYGLHVAVVKIANSDTEKEEKISDITLHAIWVAVLGSIFLFCCIPICGCGLSRIIISRKSQEESKFNYQYSALNNEE